MTQDDIIRIAREAGIEIRGHYDEMGATPQELARFAALVAQHEREACAKVCARVRNEWVLTVDGRRAAADCANAIRARGEVQG